jgi:transcriptional regulator with XRE-family HTH domain
VSQAALATRLAKAAQAARLRDEKGLSGIQIAEAMGLSRAYVCSLLADPDGSRAVAYKRGYKGTCRDCGRQTSYLVGGFAERCQACANRHRARWDRAEIVAAIRRWARRFGEPPAANDWNKARVRNRPEKLARLRGGDWPSLGTV